MKNSCRNAVKTTCPYCGVGCGVQVKIDADNILVDGDKDHPSNYGKLCSKGYALPDTLQDSQRLRYPLISGSAAGWENAIERIAYEFQSVIETHGPEAIGFYVSGQLLTEDYYAVNKFVKGYLGTANIDTNSRLCMASSVAGHKRAFGSDTVPGCYEDLELADVIVLVGSNLAWCHPVLFQRIQKAKEKNSLLQVVVVDPRTTATAEQCDMHLPVRAGGDSDAALFLGLLRYLEENQCLNQPWIRSHANGVAAALEQVAEWTVSTVAEHTGLSAEQVQAFYALYERSDKVMTVYSQGVNQSHRGTDTVNSIINVHLATGAIGKEGSGPFSITGQPNAMGGREVGGLANMLACHMDIENESHRDLVQRYWNSPRIVQSPGLKAVELFDAVKTGQVKALWVMATNPVNSMPNANVVSDAIADCPFVVVSDVTSQSDTAKHATVLLPSKAWSEKDGTVTNSERRISRQRAFRKAPGEARPDWWAVCRVASRMGYEDAFDFQSACDIFKEYAGLSGFENNGSRDFDIGALQGISGREYESLLPFQWPLRNETSPSSNAGTRSADTQSKRLFTDGVFFTDDSKARFIPIVLHRPNLSTDNHSDTVTDKNARSGVTEDRPGTDIIPTDAETFLLNTGRIRDQWHTMTRTGNSARLSSHLGEPFVEIHPADANRTGLTNAGIAEVSSGFGSVQVRVLVTDRVAVGTVFIPMHWSNDFASNARVNALVHSLCDPVSGQPALKNQRVTIRACRLNSFGFMVSRQKPVSLAFEYWACAPVENGWKTEFASDMQPAELADYLTTNMTETLIGADLIQFSDKRLSHYRMSWFAADRLYNAVFLSSEPVQVARNAVSSLLGHTFENQIQRLSVVSAAGLATREDTGATICSCLQVGVKTIQKAIDSGCVGVQAIGDACGAGTQCGSCRAELTRLLSRTQTRKAEIA